MFQVSAGQESGPKPSGYTLPSRLFLLLLSWGRFPRRGRPCVSSVSRTLNLRASRSTPEGCGAAHGPRHPAYPLLLRPVMSSWGFRFLFSWLLGSAWVFTLKQRFFVRFFLPFKTRPLLECLFGSLSLSLSLSFSCCLVVFVRRRRVSLFLSSSGAGETQTALRFVVPLVFLLCIRIYTYMLLIYSRPA